MSKEIQRMEKMVERNLSAVAPSGYHLVTDDITSPGGTAGQHYKREFVPTTALMPPIIPTFYRTRWTGSDSVHWRIISIPVFPLALGRICERCKSMGTVHIGKFDLQEPCGQPPGGQNIEGSYPSNLATSYKCGDFISPTSR